MNEQPKTAIVPRDYHSVIEKVAAIKNLTAEDLSKLQQMMTMQEEWEKRQAATHFNENMALAQGEMTQISKDSSNPQTRSRYASLEALDEAIRPIYSKYGFSVSFNDETPDDRDGWLRLIAYVSNGAETRKYTKWLPVGNVGLRGQAMMTPTHASIAAVTYGRRALHKMIWNLAEVDTDGNLKNDKVLDEATERSENPAPPEQQKADVGAIIAEMRKKKDHTALYAYKEGYIKTIWPKIFPADREQIEKEYKAMMDKFAEQQK